MKIALTVGHSLLKNGLYTSADGTDLGGGNEYKFNKSLSKYLAKQLRKRNHKVNRIVCPERQFLSSKEERAYKLNIVNKKNYDLIIELHLNAGPKTAEGCEVLYVSEKGKTYAQSVQTQLSKLFKDRGAKKIENLYMLNQTKPVCIMIETFFCTNSKEWKIGKKNKKKIAKLIAKGI